MTWPKPETSIGWASIARSKWVPFPLSNTLMAQTRNLRVLVLYLSDRRVLWASTISACARPITVGIIHDDNV